MVFVTGASGFIGKALTKKLIGENKKIVTLTRDFSTYEKVGDEVVIEGNLSDINNILDQLKMYSIDAVIHLAWEGIPNYGYEMSSRNLRYGLNVLDVCKKLKTPKLVITGSCWEYRNPSGVVSTKHELDYEKCFSVAKKSLHAMAHVFCEENNIHFNWLRLFYVYGPGQRKVSLIPHIIEQLENKRELELKGAYNRNDFVYVEDVADAIVKVIGGDYPEVLNVGSGKSTRVLDIAKEVAHLLNASIDEKSYSLTGNEVDFCADINEMIDSYGWQPKVSINEGIKRMLSNYTVKEK